MKGIEKRMKKLFKSEIFFVIILGAIVLAVDKPITELIYSIRNHSIEFIETHFGRKYGFSQFF